MTLVFDTPDQIEGFRLLTILHGLKLEVEMPAKFPWATPKNTPTRGRAFVAAQGALAKYGVVGPGKNGQWRTRKQALAGMQALCKELGLPTREEEPSGG